MQQHAGGPGGPAGGGRSHSTTLHPALSAGFAALAVLTLDCSRHTLTLCPHQASDKTVCMTRQAYSLSCLALERLYNTTVGFTCVCVGPVSRDPCYSSKTWLKKLQNTNRALEVGMNTRKPRLPCCTKLGKMPDLLGCCIECKPCQQKQARDMQRVEATLSSLLHCTMHSVGLLAHICTSAMVRAHVIGNRLLQLAD